jgi:5-methylcytosine-specific restriction endonuclease McrA
MTALSVLVKNLREKFEQPVRHIFTPEERQQMFNDANGVCEECSKKMTLKEMNIDHIIPLCVGGSNEPENLQVLCKKCHFVKSKDERDNHHFLKYLKRYHPSILKPEQY